MAEAPQARVEEQGTEQERGGGPSLVERIKGTLGLGTGRDEAQEGTRGAGKFSEQRSGRAA